MGEKCDVPKSRDSQIEGVLSVEERLFNGILNIENLTDLDKLLKYEGFKVIALPLQKDAKAL